MAGFPLAAIGTGLGLFAQDYLKKRQADSQLDLTRAALQKEKQQRDAESLLGGLPGSAFTTGAGDISSPAGGSMGRPPGAGGAPVGSPATPMIQPKGGLNLPGSRFMPPQQAQDQPLDYGSPQANQTLGAPGAGTTRPSEAGNPNYQGGRYVPERDTGESIGATGDDMRIPLDGPQAVARQPAVGTTGPQNPPAGGNVGTTGPQSAGGNVVPINNPIVQRLLGPTLDLGGVMDRIRAARPGADPGTVWRAATMMYEMVEKGNQSQMNNAIKALTQLRLQDQLGERVQHDRATEAQGNQRLGISQQRADTSASQGDRRLDIGQQRADTGAAAQVNTAADRATRRQQGDYRLGQGDERLQLGRGRLGVTERQGDERLDISRGRADTAERQGDQRIQQGDRRLDQGDQRIGISRENLAIRQQQYQSAVKRADDLAKRGDRNGSRGIYSTMLTSLRAQLNPPLGSTPPDDQTRAWLQQQIDDVTNRLRALDSMGEAPARPTAPAQ